MKKRSRSYISLREKININNRFDSAKDAILFLKENSERNFSNYKLSIFVRKADNKGNIFPIKGDVAFPNCELGRIFLIKNELDEEVVNKLFDNEYKKRVFLIDLTDFLSLSGKKNELKKTGFFKLVIHDSSIDYINKYKKELIDIKFYPNKKNNILHDTFNLFKEIDDFDGKSKKFSSDKDGNFSFNLGSSKFNADELFENYNSIVKKVLLFKPVAWKGKFFDKIIISTTNSPGVRINF